MVQRVGESRIKMWTKHNFLIYRVHEKEDSHHISCTVGDNGLISSGEPSLDQEVGNWNEDEIINSTTLNKEEKKYKTWKKEFTELYSGKESTDVGTEE